ncbi:MAG: hypothetical protein QE271_08270 [Bacteriovoracaceae bacterium]|nr:hypothetical protein [Bacteriovoracaceae bacterium]
MELNLWMEWASGNPLLIFLIIIGASFILEDPTTLLVGSLIATNHLTYSMGFISLLVGIFLGDLFLYLLGFAIHQGLFKKAKNFMPPTTFTIGIARFIPGMRTITFTAAGFNKIFFPKFILIIACTSLIWTWLLLTFTKTIVEWLKFFPSHVSWILGVFVFILLQVIERTVRKKRAHINQEHL